MAWKIIKDERQFEICEEETLKRITWPTPIKHLKEWEAIVSLANLNFALQEKDNEQAERDRCGDLFDRGRQKGAGS